MAGAGRKRCGTAKLKKAKRFFETDVASGNEARKQEEEKKLWKQKCFQWNWQDVN
ncbi:MAG TPA: hypothetical protein PKU80_01610 [Candidatus Limiplasma sp.]|nr:hypothetical protein [Candidatus Limiplasma sp.]HRX07917.1 hypothetical protein [Candidatus Limiplasma sp.]